ncbi:MAG: phage capsid protein [Thermonemataceae bacterium]|nr:phage capsid protein [Thermonemataceae bacterium]
MATIQKDLWLAYASANIFPDNSFLNHCADATDFVVGGKIVVKPQAGTLGTTTKNPSFPLSITVRSADDITYPLDFYGIPPIAVRNPSQFEEKPETMALVMDEQIASATEAMSNNILFDWVAAFPANAGLIPGVAVAAATVIRTSGSATAAHLADATGTRLLLLKKDLLKAAAVLNKQGVSKQDRYALLSSDMLAQLMSDEDVLKYERDNEIDPKTGIVTRIAGFNILERASTLTYNNAATPAAKAVGAATAATDNDAVICWQKNAVDLAKGEIDIIEENNRSEYPGCTIISGIVYAAGRKRRSDAKGIVAIVQGV